MNEHEFAQGLFDLLNNALEAAIDGDVEVPEGFAADDMEDECPGGLKQIQTYEEAGVLTRDAGLVVRMWDGAEFQVTIKRSR